MPVAGASILAFFMARSFLVKRGFQCSQRLNVGKVSCSAPHYVLRCINGGLAIGTQEWYTGIRNAAPKPLETLSF